MIQKHATSCCALAHMTAGNLDTFEELSATVEKVRSETESENYLNTKSDYGGQRALFTIVAPNEDKLVINLAKLGFEPGIVFPRRNGYPKGTLQMWTLIL